MGLDVSTHASSTIDEDGHIEITRAAVGDDASAAPAVTLHPAWFAGRPSDTVDDNGAHILHWDEGSTEFAVAMHDPRVAPPALEKGGSAHYCAVTGAWARFNGLTGAYEVQVPSGVTVSIQVGTGAKVVVSDATVKIGDDSALPLGDGAAVTAILLALNALATAMSALTPPATPATFAAFNALGGTLTGLLAGISKTQTTQALGT